MVVEEVGEAEEEEEAPGAVDMEACEFVRRVWVCNEDTATDGVCRSAEGMLTPRGP